MARYNHVDRYNAASLGWAWNVNAQKLDYLIIGPKPSEYRDQASACPPRAVTLSAKIPLALCVRRCAQTAPMHTGQATRLTPGIKTHARQQERAQR